MVVNGFMNVCVSFHVQVWVKAELDSIREGLEVLDVLSLLQRNPHTLRQLFIAYQQTLTADSLQDLFAVQFSPNGSNSREKEEELIMFWVTFLNLIEGKLLVKFMCSVLMVI